MNIRRIVKEMLVLTKSMNERLREKENELKQRKRRRNMLKESIQE